MHNSRQSYQSFMSEFAKPTEDEDGNLVPSEDALEKFAARVRQPRCCAASCVRITAPKRPT